MAEGTATQEPAWPMRTWVLAALGMAAALAMQQLIELPDSGWEWGKRLVSAAVLFIGVSGVAFALAWKRDRHIPAIAIALLCGLVAGGVFIWNGLPDDSGFVVWRLPCGLVGSGFLLALFQAVQDRYPHLPERWNGPGLLAWKRTALDYSDLHRIIWVDALLIGAALLFAGITFAVFALLSEMFMLVKIDLLRELMRKRWFDALLFGAAFAGAIGILRDRSVIIGALQKVAMIVLRVLAPVLAVGLVLFLVALFFTGLAPLWATGNTTPLMLGGAVIALFLIIAVIGERQEDAALARVLRWGAMALGLTLLPLVLIAAWSTGLRIGQYGYSPDRLWALTFIILGTITAVAYAVAIVAGMLGRGDWIARLYRSNLHLAFLLGGVALLLSTPIVSFERMATRDQVARLESGKIKPADFDYRGLWFDFGPPGKAAIKKLAKDAKDAKVREFAAATQKLDYRYEEAPNELARKSGDDLDKRLTILPAKVPLDPRLRTRLAQYGACNESGPCTLYYVPGESYAITVWKAGNCDDCDPVTNLIEAGPKGDWPPSEDLRLRVGNERHDNSPSLAARRAKAVTQGKIEMRQVPMRQLYIDGEPFGDPIPLENAAQP